MTKEVWVSIRGLQSVDMQSQDPIEVIYAGEYYFRNGKHYVLYEEALDGVGKILKNRLKITEDCVEMVKKGRSVTQMIFKKGARNQSDYQTDYGTLRLGLYTREIRLAGQEDRISVEMEYALDMSEAPLADCTLMIQIWPREEEK